MSALPIEPTERDRERFRDITKAMQFGLEYDRHGDDYKYDLTAIMFRLWWSVERERQLLPKHDLLLADPPYGIGEGQNT